MIELYIKKHEISQDTFTFVIQKLIQHYEYTEKIYIASNSDSTVKKIYDVKLVFDDLDKMMQFKQECEECLLNFRINEAKKELRNFELDITSYCSKRQNKANSSNSDLTKDEKPDNYLILKPHCKVLNPMRLFLVYAINQRITEQMIPNSSTTTVGSFSKNSNFDTASTSSSSSSSSSSSQSTPYSYFESTRQMLLAAGVSE